MKTAVSVIIPTYNGLSLLENNLPILFTAMADGDEVIIVDDASTDETVITLLNTYHLEKSTENLELGLPKNYFPSISSSSVQVYEGETTHRDKKLKFKLVINTNNQRFAASANIGVALAQHEWVFLLNNDVKVDSSCLNHLKTAVKNNDKIFAVGCIEYSDKTKSDPSGKNKLWFEKGIYMHSKTDDFEPGKTAWASGGSGLFSKEKWLELGGFDLHFYPAYWEDIDLSYRATVRGWSVLFEPAAIVYHKHETTNANVLGLKKITSMSWRHAQYFTWKHSSFSQKIEFILRLPYWAVKRFIAENR